MFRTVLIAALVLVTAVVNAQDQPFQPARASADHEILQRFVGQWDCQTELFNADGTAVTTKGSIQGRMLGDFWAVIDVTGDFLGQPYMAQGTFGFDSTRSKSYIGTWVDSMSDFMWKYEGTVERNKLVLNSEGPDPSQPDKMIKAVDTWEFVSENQMILTGQFQGADGNMVTMVRVTCTRKK